MPIITLLSNGDTHNMLLDALIAFSALLSKAFTKIIIMLLAVFITFLALPQSRNASMVGVAIISSFAGGILVQMFQDERAWSVAYATSIAFGAGFAVFLLLIIYSKFYNMLANDDELFKAIYSKLRGFILNKVDNSLDS